MMLLICLCYTETKSWESHDFYLNYLKGLLAVPWGNSHCPCARDLVAPPGGSTEQYTGHVMPQDCGPSMGCTASQLQK